MYRNILKTGDHLVMISRVFYGNSRYKGTPYFKCCFENSDGYIPKIIYVTEASKPLIKKLFEAIDINKEEVDTNELIGKKLLIKVEEMEKIDYQTGEVSGKYYECVRFIKSVEILLKENNQANLTNFKNKL